MSNQFALQFRRKKLFVAVGLMLGLLVTPLLQASHAAGSAALDVNEALRIDGGPNASNHYSRNIAVQDHNVVEVSAVLHNPEDPNSGKVAENARLRYLLPKGSVSSARPNVEALSNNLAPRAPYTTQDSVDMTSANGQPFQINGNIRSFKVQRNQNQNPRDPNFKWDQGASIPYGQIDIAETDRYYQITVKPNANGQLKPCFHEAVKVSFLIDIAQPTPPQLTITKKERLNSQGEYVKSNTAKVGDQIQYVVMVTNPSQVTEHDVVIRDSLPPHTTLVPGTVKVRDSKNPSDTVGRPLPDADATNGISYTTFAPGAYSYLYLTVNVGSVPTCPYSFDNVGFVRSQETNNVEYYDKAHTDVQCQPTPTPTPSITPTPTPTPTPSMTPTASPTPTVVPETGNLVITKFDDHNGNGQMDNGDQGLQGVTFTVCQTAVSGSSNGQQVTKMTEAACADYSTNADGKIVLTNIQPGTYSVTEHVPGGWRATTASSQNVTVVNNSTAEAKFGDQQVCVSPSPAPSSSPSPSASPTPTPTVCSPSPTPTPTTPPASPQPPMEKGGNLPNTGQSALALLATMTIAGSAYLYRRERKNLLSAANDSHIVS